MFHFKDIEGDTLTIAKDASQDGFFLVASDKIGAVALVFDSVDDIDGIIDALQHVKAKMEGGE